MGRVKYRKTNSFTMSENLNLNASTSLAHLILAGSSAWAFKYTSKDHPFAYATYTFLFGHSLIGAINFGHPTANETIHKIYEQSAIVAEVAPIPLITTQLLLLSGNEQNNLSYVPAATAAIPLLTQFLTEHHNSKIIDLVIAGNLGCLMYYAVKYESPWTYGLIALIFLNQFIFSKVSERYEVPKMDFIAVGLSFFCVFGVNCICDALAS